MSILLATRVLAQSQEKGVSVVGLNEGREEIREGEYERPKVVDYGDLVALTAGASTGSELDADFPIHTKFSNLTFSN